MTKVGFGADTLTNIPVSSCFRHEQDLNPGGSRMEIYETISHVSTNQVWLHINSASSRVYFRPIAPSSPSLLGGCGPTCQKLPVPRLPSIPPFLPLICCYSLFSYSTTSTFSPSLHLVCTLYIVNSLSYSSLEIVSLNHPRLPASTERRPSNCSTLRLNYLTPSPQISFG